MTYIIILYGEKNISSEEIVLEEVYRFKNGAVDKNGTLVWDIENLVFYSKDNPPHSSNRCR